MACVEQGVILAAGRGTRLGALGIGRPKAMLPVAGKPIVARVLDQFAAAGLRHIIVVVAAGDGQVQRSLAEHSPRRVQIDFVSQPQQLGMADALQCAAPLLTADFLLGACDSIYPQEHYQNLLAAHAAQKGSLATLTLLEVHREEINRTGIVAFAGGRVVRIVEKPSPPEAPTPIASLSLYVFSHRLLSFLEGVPLSERGEFEIQNAIQRLLSESGPVNHVFTGWRLELTRPDDLLTINRYYLKQLGCNGAPGVQAEITPPVYIEPGAEVGPHCRLGPLVYVEAGARVEAGAEVIDAVVLRGGVVPSASRVWQQVVHAAEPLSSVPG